MPNISIKYTGNINPTNLRGLCVKIHNTLTAICDANLSRCKSTISVCEDFIIGDGQDCTQAFFKVSIALLTGRSNEQKSKLKDAVFSLLQECITPDCENSNLNCSFFVRIKELTKDKDYFF